MFTAAFYNLKGGVGKTASCVNFAYLAAQDGYRTLLWDLDPQGAASYYFKVSAEKGSAKKLVEQTLGMDEVIVATEYPLLDMIPADLSARKLDLILHEEDAGKKRVKQLLKTVAKEYEFVFIDCPPGFSTLADNLFYGADAVLMPVIPTTLSVRTYELVKEYLKDKGLLDSLACFFNMADGRRKMHTEIMEELHRDKRFFEYYIPYLSDIEKMGSKQAPVAVFAPMSYAAVCYRALWGEIKEGVL